MTNPHMPWLYSYDGYKTPERRLEEERLRRQQHEDNLRRWFAPAGAAWTGNSSPDPGGRLVILLLPFWLLILLEIFIIGVGSYDLTTARGYAPMVGLAVSLLALAAAGYLLSLRVVGQVVAVIAACLIAQDLVNYFDGFRAFRHVLQARGLLAALPHFQSGMGSWGGLGLVLGTAGTWGVHVVFSLMLRDLRRRHLHK